MKLMYQAKIEVLLDKINLLYSNIKDDEGLPRVEIQLIKKYSKELTEIIEKLEQEISDKQTHALPPVTIIEKPASEVRDEKLNRDDSISKKVEEVKAEPVKEAKEKNEKEPYQKSSSLTFMDEPAKPKEIKEENGSQSGTKLEQQNSSGESDKTESPESKLPISKKVSSEKVETDLKTDKSESDRAEIYKTLEQMKAKREEAKKMKLIGEEEEGEDEENSINTRFKGQESNLVDKLKGRGINDLRTEVDLNNKFWFINNLFEGDSENYKRAVSQINELPNISEANTFIDNQLKPKYNWEKDDKAVEKFMEFVNRKFI